MNKLKQLFPGETDSGLSDDRRAVQHLQREVAVARQTSGTSGSGHQFQKVVSVLLNKRQENILF